MYNLAEGGDRGSLSRVWDPRGSRAFGHRPGLRRSVGPAFDAPEPRVRVGEWVYQYNGYLGWTTQPKGAVEVRPKGVCRSSPGEEFECRLVRRPETPRPVRRVSPVWTLDTRSPTPLPTILSERL